MKINPAMLALSAANPGLITMATWLGNQYSSSSYGSKRVEAKVSGSIEHSFKAGSGDELRGIAVDNERAAQAYQKALKAIDEFKAGYAGEIAEIEAEIQAKIEAAKEKNEAKRQERNKRREERKLEEKKNDARRKELSRKRGGFWGLSSEEEEEYKRLTDWAFDPEGVMESHMLVFELQMILNSRERSPSRLIDEVRRRIADANAIAVTSQNSLYLSRNDVIEIHKIETDIEGWMSQKSGFASVLHHVEQKNMSQKGD